MSVDRQQARQRYEAAVAAEQRGDIPAALAELSAAVALDPTRAGWHHRLARLYGRRRQWREAVTAAQAALDREPDRPTRHYWLGRARERWWDLAGAQAAYQSAVALAPERADWAQRLAEVRQAATTIRPYRGMVIAHRGRSGPASENVCEGLNTVPAHAAGVEVDVRCTRDRVPVLLHDRRVDRTTDGQGELAELRYRQLAKLRGPGGVRVPTLADYLEACAGRGFRQILLDVKAAGPAELAAVTEVVAGSPVAPVCVLMVREEGELAAARGLGDQWRLGGFGVRVANLAPRLAAARAHRAELLLAVLGSQNYLANRAVIGPVRAAGLRAGASTINSAAALAAAREDSCDLLMTDLSDQLSYFTGADPSPSISPTPSI